MKRECPTHPKTLALQAALGESHRGTIGALELFWHFTARYCPDGDVTKHAPGAIASAIGWTGDASLLIESLVKCGFVDRRKRGKLIVHDWREHCDRGVHMQLARQRKRFADGSLPTLGHLTKDEREEAQEWFNSNPATKRNPCTQRVHAVFVPNPRPAPPSTSLQNPAPPTTPAPCAPAPGGDTAKGGSGGVASLSKLEGGKSADTEGRVGSMGPALRGEMATIVNPSEAGAEDKIARLSFLQARGVSTKALQRLMGRVDHTLVFYTTTWAEVQADANATDKIGALVWRLEHNDPKVTTGRKYAAAATAQKFMSDEELAGVMREGERSMDDLTLYPSGAAMPARTTVIYAGKETPEARRKREAAGMFPAPDGPLPVRKAGEPTAAEKQRAEKAAKEIEDAPIEVKEI